MRKKTLVIVFSLVFFLMLIGSNAASTRSHSAPEFSARTSTPDSEGEVPSSSPYLRVLTLNAAHGRRDSINQLFVSESGFRNNLANIGQILKRERIDIVALQEMDKPSLWSGSFDHAEAVADEAGYRWKVHAEHARSWLYKFGTALLSRLPVVSHYSHRFSPSPPSLRKGFVVAQVEWAAPGFSSSPLLIDIVSVHLDFLSGDARQAQIDEMVSVLANRKNPKIVLGDFNSDWQSPDSSIKKFAEKSGLIAYHSEQEDLSTHNGERIDWILLSPQFEFLSYEVLPDLVSDHKAIVAEIALQHDES